MLRNNRDHVRGRSQTITNRYSPIFTGANILAVQPGRKSGTTKIVVEAQCYVVILASVANEGASHSGEYNSTRSQATARVSPPSHPTLRPAQSTHQRTSGC